MPPVEVAALPEFAFAGHRDQPSLSIRSQSKGAFGHSTSHTQSVALERYAGAPINWALLRPLMALLP
jgi:hypothetical protein